MAHWNAYFNAMMYLSDSKKFPLQIALREILMTNSIADATDTTMKMCIRDRGVHAGPGQGAVQSDHRRWPDEIRAELRSGAGHQRAGQKVG